MRFDARVLALFLIFFAYAPPLWSDPGSKIYFIVNRENPVTELTAKQVSDMYLKKRREWPSGTTVRFIDKASHSSARRVFLRKYLGQSAEDLELYWIGQKLQSGEGAPLQEASDSMTIRFVAAFEGAIGYVSSPPGENKDVKVVKVKGRNE